MTSYNVPAAVADAADPVRRLDAVGGGGARPPILAQEPPLTTSALRPGLRPQSDPPPRSRLLITGDTSPELPLIGFAHPGGDPFGPSPGALTGTAHLATGYEPKASPQL